MKRLREEHEHGWQREILHAASLNGGAMDVDETLTELELGEGVDHSRFQHKYIRIMHRVIQDSDVIIFVLDARDPEGCRNPPLEEELRKREVEGKKFIFLLNKTDLVPKANTEAWLRYLRHIAPTVAFRASTQQQRENIASKTSNALLHVLKSFKRPSQTLVVGVVGYPNVGKSSVINSLKRSKVCSVGADPGWTKDMQIIQVERGIKLLDSPGVIFDLPGSNSHTLALRNIFKVSDIADPISVAALIYDRISPLRMSNFYKLPQDDSRDFQRFIVQHALSSGRLMKSGIADVECAARSIVRDWNANKLPFYTEAPKAHASSLPGHGAGAADVGEAMVVSGSLAPAFDLDGLLDDVDQFPSDSVSVPDTQSKYVKQEKSPPETTERTKRRRTDRQIDQDYAVGLSAIPSPMSRKAQKLRSKRSRKDAKRASRPY